MHDGYAIFFSYARETIEMEFNTKTCYKIISR